jgi:hypothetical protein
MNNTKTRVLLVGLGLVLTMAACKTSSEGSPTPADLAVADLAVRSDLHAEAQGSMGGHLKVWIEPGDLMSSVGTSPLRVVVSMLGAKVGTNFLDKLAANVVLKTYPQRQPVAVTTVSHDVKFGTWERPYVLVTPKAPLADQWHVLMLEPFPKSVAAPAAGTDLDLNGSMYVRFHPGSAPVLARIGGCKKADGYITVALSFSEKIQAVPPEPIVSIKQQGVSLGCTFAPPSTKRISARCPKLSFTTPLEIIVGTGLVSISAGAKPVTALDGKSIGTISFVPATAKTVNDCFGWKPPF